MSGNSINNHRPKTSISVSGLGKEGGDHLKNSQILNQDYGDKLTEIFINSHCSLDQGEKVQLEKNIREIRKTFSEHTDNNILSVWINVFDSAGFDIDKFKKTYTFPPSDYGQNSIHVKFGNTQDKILVYSWLDTNQFNQDEWNNLLSQLKGDGQISLIGTGPLTFKYKDFNYRVYPPYLNPSYKEALNIYKPSAFSCSPEEVNQIVEDIKESHQSIEKKITDHYKSLGKDFVKDGEGYIHIKAGIESDVKNFTDVSYTNRSDNIHNKPIEKVFIKDEDDLEQESLHLYVYEDKKGHIEMWWSTYANTIEKENANGRTPLHLAAKYGRAKIAEFLLEKNANVNAVDSRGKTPLHLAAQYNEKKEIVEMLLNKGAKVDVVDNRDRTPLHYAAKNGHVEIVEVLLAADGIDINAKDEDGKTPFDLAKTEEIKTLLKNAENPDSGSTNNEGDPQEDTGKEKQEIKKENSEEESQRKQAEEGTDVKTEGVKTDDEHPSSTEPTQTEEQTSSFFDSLFSILMKPFSLVVSFFSGFFSWLFRSDEPTQPSPEPDQMVVHDSSDDLL